VSADSGEGLCSFLLAIPATYYCNTVWGCKLMSVMMVAICNLFIEYGHCNVKQVYDNV